MPLIHRLPESVSDRLVAWNGTTIGIPVSRFNPRTLVATVSTASEWLRSRNKRLKTMT